MMTCWHIEALVNALKVQNTTLLFQFKCITILDFVARIDPDLAGVIQVPCLSKFARPGIFSQVRIGDDVIDTIGRLCISKHIVNQPAKHLAMALGIKHQGAVGIEGALRL
mmetsp:Transcript_14607/g.45151  ORF Transcript_14607/g.45151 Transcript_14607/m.45151 type:complete len:110 (+) Transcript_14607:5731-6060(+)